MQRITLIRHGESTWNASGRFQGHSNSVLSVKGEAQARALRRRLTPVLARADRVESSDLARATRTAELAGAAPIERPIWREVFLGDWEGLYFEEVEARFGDQLKALERGEPIRPGGGESWPEMRTRIGDAMQRLCAELPPDGRAVVFCHGGVILSVVSAAFALPDTLPRCIKSPINTCVTEVGLLPDGGVVLLRYNDVTHLTEREPRARSGRLARLRVGEGAVDWPPAPAPTDPISIVGPAEVLRGHVQAILGDAGVGRLGPLETEAHVQVHPSGQVLVDYNLRPGAPSGSPG